jgi:hypothetical protein
MRHRADLMPLGVTGNTSDSGSEESWFEPRRGNSAVRRGDSPSGEVAKWLRQRFAKPSGPKGSRGFESHPLRAGRRREPHRRSSAPPDRSGQVSEWLKEHDWKSCGAQALVGSNPTLSVVVPGSLSPAVVRGVAQPGRALRSGRRGRRFKSCLPDGLVGNTFVPCPDPGGVV